MYNRTKFGTNVEQAPRIEKFVFDFRDFGMLTHADSSHDICAVSRDLD